MAIPQLKLTYFEGVGRAELTRLALAFGDIPFVYERIKGEDFHARRSTLPLGQLPVLEIDGTTYSQSMALARYAAKLSGLYPPDAVGALRVDMIIETLVDLTTAFATACFAERDEVLRAEKTKKFTDEAVPKALGVLESMVQGEFFGGDSISLADLHLFDLVTNGLRIYAPGFTTAPFPKLETVIENVKANVNIAAHLATSNS